MRCVIEWAAGARVLYGAEEWDVEDVIAFDPPRALCARAHGERVKATLVPSPPASKTVRITSTARLAEKYSSTGAFVGSVVGSVDADGGGSNSSTPTFYTLEVLVGYEALELRFAGIKSGVPFLLKRIEAVEAAAAPTTTTQQQQVADLIALVQQQQQQHNAGAPPPEVPEDLRELFGKASAAPGSAQAQAVQQMAAMLARGVLTGGGGGNGGGGGGGEAAATARGTTQSPEDAPTQQQQHYHHQQHAILDAIAQSEARVLAAVDALAQRVAALEAAAAADGPRR